MFWKAKVASAILPTPSAYWYLQIHEQYYITKNYIRNTHFTVYKQKKRQRIKALTFLALIFFMCFHILFRYAFHAIDLNFCVVSAWKTVGNFVNLFFVDLEVKDKTNKTAPQIFSTCVHIMLISPLNLFPLDRHLELFFWFHPALDSLGYYLFLSSRY